MAAYDPVGLRTVLTTLVPAANDTAAMRFAPVELRTVLQPGVSTLGVNRTSFNPGFN